MRLLIETTKVALFAGSVGRSATSSISNDWWFVASITSSFSIFRNVTPPGPTNLAKHARSTTSSVGGHLSDPIGCRYVSNHISNRILGPNLSLNP